MSAISDIEDRIDHLTARLNRVAAAGSDDAACMTALADRIERAADAIAETIVDGFAEDMAARVRRFGAKTAGPRYRHKMLSPAVLPRRA